MGRLSNMFPTADAVDAALKRANKAEVDITDINGKIDREVQNLQEQIDNIVLEASESGDVSYEVAQARVGANGTSYETLKERLDEEQGKQNEQLDVDTAVLSKAINPNLTNNRFIKLLTAEDIKLEPSYGFSEYRGYGYSCRIPSLLCGVHLNLKIGGNDGNVNVPIQVSVLDKDSHQTLWSITESFRLTFADGFAYVRHKDILLDSPVFGLPETAYVFIEVPVPYKLVVTGANPPQNLINYEFFVEDETYHTIYRGRSDDIQMSGANGYICDFGLYYADITEKKLENIDNQVNAIKKSLDENYELLRMFNQDFDLTKKTYGFVDYRGYGYLINNPGVFGGVWFNILITPSSVFDTDYTASIPITISLRDKETGAVIYEFTKECEVNFIADDGFGKLRNTSIFTDSPVANLPDQYYLYVILPIGYNLNVTSNESSNKFSSLPVLDVDYDNLFIGSNQKINHSNQIYKYTCDIGVYNISYVLKGTEKKRLYNLHDAFMKWTDGEKFPIAFAGDSTTDGYRTTNYVGNVLGTDHTSGYLYTDILQSMLRQETNNNSLRIYNAGFSGKTIYWMMQNFDAEFGINSAYADVKMIGVSFGINDRPKTEEQYNSFKQTVISFCKKCLEKNIQPFLLTSQAGAENSDNLNRHEAVTISYANKAKFEVAEELNLEIIDVSTMTANFLNCSNRPLQTILYDYCHFADYGHKYEGGMFFREFVPRTITVDDDSRIGFETQGIKSDLQWGDQALKQVQMLSNPYEGFKTKANVSGRSETTDIVVFDAWVFIDGESPLTLKTYCGTANTLHCLVDGVNTVLTTTEQTIEKLDLGLHHIVVKSGSSANIDFYGIKLVKQP